MPFSDPEMRLFQDLRLLVAILQTRRAVVPVGLLMAEWLEVRPHANASRLEELLPLLVNEVERSVEGIRLLSDRREYAPPSPRGPAYTADEARRVVDAYPLTRDEIHERSAGVIALAAMLGRPRRSVENQLLMCRALERGNYGREHVGGLIRDAWNAVASQPDDGRPRSRFEAIQRLGFGGQDVAATPHTNLAEWPRAAGLPGMDELREHVGTRIARGDGPIWVFLIGSAGNGKSAWVAELARGIGLVLQEDARALRAYEDRTYNLVLINDATIVGRNYAEPSRALAQDVCSWAARHDVPSAVVCINRGIITEEVRAAAGGPESAVAENLLRWLDEPAGRHPAITNIDDTGDHYHRAKMRLPSGVEVELHALAVDAYSLFHPHPVPPLRPGSAVPTSTTVREMTTQFVRRVVDSLRSSADQRPLGCPLRANVECLAAPLAVENFIALIAAAEVVSGQYLSYRDLWGVLSVALAGPRRIRRGQDAGSPDRWVDVRLPPEDGPPTERWRAIQQLAGTRAHVALLGIVPVPIVADGHPAAGAFQALDGARGGGSRQVMDIESAISEVDFGRLPSAFIWGTPEDRARAGWTAFDESVERAAIAYIGEPTVLPPERRKVRRWLARYHIGFATLFAGCFAHREVVDAWRRAVDDELSQQFRNALAALMNGRSDGGRLILPALGPIVRPLSGATPLPLEQVAVAVNPAALELSRRIRAGRTWLEVKDARGKLVTDTPLDFGLVREALAVHSGGMTEQGTELAPRLERARAAILRKELERDGTTAFRVRVGEEWL